MNERIKLLAEQAGMTDDKFGMYFAKDKHREDGVDLEKFTELIVQECAQVAADFVPGYGLEPFSKRFKEHYGVEEK